MTDDVVPPARKLRWPILVVLDQMGEEHEILTFQARVAEHIGLPADVDEVLDQRTGRHVLTDRLIQAMEDLHQADAIGTDEDAGRVWITDVGRRFTESEAEDLTEAPRQKQADAPLDQEKPSISDWIFSLLDGFHPG